MDVSNGLFSCCFILMLLSTCFSSPFWKTSSIIGLLSRLEGVSSLSKGLLLRLVWASCSLPFFGFAFLISESFTSWDSSSCFRNREFCILLKKVFLLYCAGLKGISDGYLILEPSFFLTNFK